MCIRDRVQASAAVADTDSIIRRLSSDRSVRSQKDSAEMSVWLVLFSCIFIIFTTLSIGVSERARRLALMRALGLGRMQIALLIAGEGIFLCIPALLGGLAAGFFLVYLLEEGSASVPVLTWSTVLTAAVCAVAVSYTHLDVYKRQGKRLFPLANGMELRLLPNKAAAGVPVGALVDKE